MVKVLDNGYVSRYAVKTPAELEELLKSFKDIVSNDWQVNDVQADRETFKLKQLICTCQYLANQLKH